MADLIFSNAPLVGPPWALVFNESPDGRVVARIVGTMPDLTVSVDAQVQSNVDATIIGTMPDLSVSVVAFVDEAVPQYLTAAAGAPWHDGAALPLPGACPWPSAGLTMAHTGPAWRDAWPLCEHMRGPWGNPTPVVRSGTSSRWRDGRATYAHMREPWRDLLALTRTGPSSRWREAERVGVLIRKYWRAAVGARLPISEAWSDGLRRVFDPPLSFQRGAAANQPRREPWRDAAQLVSHGGPLVVVLPPPEDERCYTPSGDLVFAGLAPASTALVFVCENHGGVPPAMVVVPIRRIYPVLDSFLLKRVVDGVYLATKSASMSLDVDSWTWGMTVTLPLAELPKVEADLDGTPVELEAVVNGAAYRVLAERVQRARQFPSGEISVQCRGIGGALDVLTGTYDNGSEARTAAQLMDDVLSVNGVGVGWSVDFGLEDWLVPAGAWTYQGTAVAALQAVAAAAGGYLQPHPTDKTLRVLPRYPVLPWNWASVTPDFELPSSVVVREAIEWIEKPRYTRVFVSGQSQGVLCQVTRAGTDGSVVAPSVTDQLVTTAAAGRQRGEAILGDTGRQALISLRMPVLPETGVIPPGKFIRYVDGAETRIGLTRSVSVEMGAGGVGHRQTIGVEAHA